MKRPSLATVVGLVWSLVALYPGADAALAQRGKKTGAQQDPFAGFVWPPPPDKARIKLEAVIAGRRDVEATSRFKALLIGAAPSSAWDSLVKPFAVALDSQGRILVTDSVTGAVIRVDRAARRWDIFGTGGRVQLKQPLGIGLAADDGFFVADVKLRQVVAFDADGAIRATYGAGGELTNPTDVAVSPDGRRLFVADSKVHQIVVFDVASAQQVARFGSFGKEPGQFHFPTSLAFGPDGTLFVVDQLNSRVQTLSAAGDPIDSFGELRVGFGGFVRPKDVEVDEAGLIYVSDAAFNNFQIFDIDFTLLTFVGSGGSGPGQFQGLSGIAVRGEWIAAVDQLGRRLQLFRYLVPKTAE